MEHGGGELQVFLVAVAFPWRIVQSGVESPQSTGAKVMRQVEKFYAKLGVFRSIAVQMKILFSAPNLVVKLPGVILKPSKDLFKLIIEVSG